ncbi:MAG: alpha-L-fucosidase [Acidobacteria bacterium]|nr:alpha-L-fucosidase [Acidobacteriota bacterium]
MNITRRSAIGLLAGTVPAIRLTAQPSGIEITKGPFTGTRESLKAYRVPDWYRDAKFGIWAHWGPQSAAEYGDWYARNMYMEGSRQYKYHVQTYGHPSKFGFKDVIATWKADKFDPDYLMQLYRKAGAKYFCGMAVHHDNFDLWNSKYQPRWNAVASGPKKDILGMFRKAALKQGLKFAVSEHLSNSYNWFSTSHGSDKSGPSAGVPYDGTDPNYADLYHDLPKDFDIAKAQAMGRNVPDSWKLQYFRRIKDLIDQFQPDLLYTDGAIPLEEYGLSLVAHLYNSSAGRHGGKVEAVYTSKGRQDAEQGLCVLDFERGIAGGISPNPWQTDTCIGTWHYNKEAKYKTPKLVIDMLVDIVSRNGNLMLNFPLPNSGMLDQEELKVLAEITKWMGVNSEAIYGTRPWKIFGDGPVAAAPAPTGGRGGAFNERGRKDLTAEEVRFTTKGSTLYAFVMGWPEKEAVIKPLATNSPRNAGKIKNVQLLGFKGKLKFTQDAAGLKVRMPAQKPCDHAVALKIIGA